LQASIGITQPILVANSALCYHLLPCAGNLLIYGSSATTSQLSEIRKQQLTLPLQT
jgi:hypothetical protein